MENNSDKTNKETRISNIGSSDFKPSHEAVFMTMSKKAEKISTALYMVTDLIKENDPIRIKIRESSINLISETRNMSYAFSGDIYFIIARTVNKAWEIVSLIEVASSVGFISDMNSRVLKNVLIEFISFLRDKQRRESFNSLDDLKMGESLSDQIILSKKLFDIEQDVSYKGQTIKDNKMSVKIEKAPSLKKPEFTTDSPKEPSMPAPKKSERRDQILSLIQQQTEVSVTDISTHFPGLSNKTIQRELISMVEEGVLKKEGDKRWSKYSMK